MADNVSVLTASALIYTGKGLLVGLAISTSAATGTATFYDNTAGSGTKILEVIVAAGHPAIMFLAERYSVPFATGLYLVLAANMSATVWSLQL